MEKVKLKDICRLINGRAYKQEELLDAGKYPVLRVGNFFSDKEFYYSDLELEDDKYCDNGDLLFAWSASFGPKIWTGEKVIYHYHIWKMELTDRVNKEYLFYYLFHLSERIKSEGHGGIMIHTTKAEMEEREFILPTIDEQKSISEILAKVEAVINKRKEELSALDDLIKARFVELFGNPNSNEKCWSMGVINDIGTCVAGATPSTKVDEYWDGGTIPWMSSGEVNKGRVFETDTFITQLGYDNASTKLVPPKTVVLAMAGQGKTRGMAAITEIELCTNQSICSIVNNEKIDAEYLLCFLRLQYKELRGASTNTDGRGGLNLKIIGNYPIMIPPIEMQKEFADFVKQVDKSKVVVQKALDETQVLFDSLMQQYFG